LTLEIHTGVEALQGQSAEISQSIESHIGNVAGATQNIQNDVQSLQRQNAQISEAMEQAKLRASRVVIVSERGTPILTASLCRRTSSGGL
jgi:hypothetical protein